MTMPRSLFLSASIAMAFASFACQEAKPPEPASTTATSDVASTEATEAPQEVAYEPAYPEEVSTEDLTDDDTAQQGSSHSHGGGEEHTHGEDQGNDDNGQHH